MTIARALDPVDALPDERTYAPAFRLSRFPLRDLIPAIPTNIELIRYTLIIDPLPLNPS